MMEFVQQINGEHGHINSDVLRRSDKNPQRLILISKFLTQVLQHRLVAYSRADTSPCID